MVTASLTKDNKWILLSSNTPYDLFAIKESFTKKIPNWFTIKQKCPSAIVDECFINSNNMMPAGLWVELINACNAKKIPLQFDKDYNPVFINQEIDENDFREYIDKLFSKSEKVKPYYYQVDAALNVLKYRKCCMEISTSGGKTLVAYMIFRYMYDRLGIKHMLYITPGTTLTTQSAEKWIKYDADNGVISDWTYSCIHSKAKKKKSYDDDTIVFGNFQSLKNKNPEFFLQFECMFEDEAHHGVAKTLKSISSHCRNAQYKIGMTGTFPKEGSHGSFVIQSYIGPVVFRKSSYELINEDQLATPVHVTAVLLDYISDKNKIEFYNMRVNKTSNDSDAGGKIMNAEKDYARNNKLRFDFICDLIKKTTKNTLVIFSDIKTKYGVKVFNHVKDTAPNKHVYYIDGHTDENARSDIKQCMEDDLDGNTIIVASIGCFSEGIDMCNLWNIFLIESTKSDNVLAQLLGRGMRKFEGKDKTVMIDFIDDYRYQTSSNDKFRNNYLYNHGVNRLGIYEGRGFPVKIVKVNLHERALF